MLICVRGVHEELEVGLLLVISEAFYLRIPGFEYLLSLEVIEVIKYGKCRRELDSLEEVFNHRVKEIFGSFIECSSHAPGVGPSKDSI